jgi:hypothetical protein
MEAHCASVREPKIDLYTSMPVADPRPYQLAQLSHLITYYSVPLTLVLRTLSNIFPPPPSPPPGPGPLDRNTHACGC